MRRILLICSIAIFACSLVDRTPLKTPTRTNPPPSNTELPEWQPRATPTKDSTPTDSDSEMPDEMEDWDASIITPYCTLLGHPDTYTELYGVNITLMWGWTSVTQEQSEDFLEHAVITVTFDGEKVTDVVREGPYFEDDAYHVIWLKELGKLERGEYAMTYRLEFKQKIFDGWDYYGPGTEYPSESDSCRLVIE